MLFAWILPNSIMAALLSVVGGAKLISILVALFASPITSLNPALGAGMVVGLVEAWLRKPKVADLERLQDDIKSVRGFYRNPFTRILLVAVLSTLGSAIGDPPSGIRPRRVHRPVLGPRRVGGIGNVRRTTP